MSSLSRPSRLAPPTRVGEVARPELTEARRPEASEAGGRSDCLTRNLDSPRLWAVNQASLVGLLKRTSRRILHDDGLADDAIQETLVSFWARGEPPENPRAWLLHAVTLRSLHLARTCRRRREHEKRAGSGRPGWSLRDDPARSLDHADLLEILGSSLDQIPDESSVVFRLWAIEELDYAGIAETLNIPVGTVRSRLSRTRRALRESLAEQFTEQDPQI